MLWANLLISYKKPQKLGGCYVIAKRNNLNDLIRISNQEILDVSRWKRHYGLRKVGQTVDGKNVISGLDVYKITSSQGFDLELLLLHLDTNNCVVDWIGYCKSATVEGWLMKTIIKKISYPIIEVYGERVWNEVFQRIATWFIAYMEQYEPSQT